MRLLLISLVVGLLMAIGFYNTTGVVKMNTVERCTYVQSQVVCAMAEILAMQAHNQINIPLGLKPWFNHDDFMAIQNKYLIGHNAVIEYLRD